MPPGEAEKRRLTQTKQPPENPGRFNQGKLPPFDAAGAHKHYKALFGDAEDLLKDKAHLILVPSGALAAN
jgi:hypothetical protein